MSPRNEAGVMPPLAGKSNGDTAYIRRRLLAIVLDLPIIMIWAIVAGIIGVVIRWFGVVIDTPTGWDVFAFVTLVAPVVLTFAVLESSPRRATFGKRRFGLLVVDRGLRRITLGRSLVRSAVRFAPWQIAHTAVFHLVAGGTAAGYVVLAVAAQILVVASVATVIVDREHRSFHDLAARTRVIDRRDEPLLEGDQP